MSEIRNHCIIKRESINVSGPGVRMQADSHESAGRVLASEIGARLWAEDADPVGRAVMAELPRLELHACRYCGCVYAMAVTTMDKEAVLCSSSSPSGEPCTLSPGDHSMHVGKTQRWGP